MGPQGGKGDGHVLGQGGGQMEGGAGRGVGQGQRVGVEGLAVQQDTRGVGGVGAEEVPEGQAVAAGVCLVGEDRVADVPQVDADLVGPPRKRSATS